MFTGFVAIFIFPTVKDGSVVRTASAEDFFEHTVVGRDPYSENTISYILLDTFPCCAVVIRNINV